MFQTLLGSHQRMERLLCDSFNKFRPGVQSLCSLSVYIQLSYFDTGQSLCIVLDEIDTDTLLQQGIPLHKFTAALLSQPVRILQQLFCVHERLCRLYLYPLAFKCFFSANCRIKILFITVRQCL